MTPDQHAPPQPDLVDRLERAGHRAARAAARRAGLYTRPVLDDAAALLVDLLLAGERHGVTDAAWSNVTDLAGACLDVTVDRHGGTDNVHQATTEQGYPAPAALAVHLVDVLHSRLVDELDVAGVHRPGPYAVSFSTCGRRRRRIMCGADGWHYDTDGPGRVEYVYAPYTEDGARAVADLIAGLVAGTTTDPLGRP